MPSVIKRPPAQSTVPSGTEWSYWNNGWPRSSPATTQVQGVMQASMDVVRQRRASGKLLDAEAKISEETLRDLGDAGYWGLLIDRSHGGVGRDLLAIRARS